MKTNLKFWFGVVASAIIGLAVLKLLLNFVGFIVWSVLPLAAVIGIAYLVIKNNYGSLNNFKDKFKEKLN